MFCVALAAGAEPITVAIEAQVVLVQDPFDHLRGRVRVGDFVSGTYTYASTRPDRNRLPTVGDYWHHDVPYGISLRLGDLVARTEPNRVDFLLEVTNDHGAPQPVDNYLLRSYVNRFDPPLPPGENHIAWQLDDPTHAALDSDALPLVPPVLSDWTSPFGLTIEAPDVFIRAIVTSAVPGRPAFRFEAFLPPIDAAPVVNLVDAGETVPIPFRLGGDQGKRIFEDGSPTSVAVDCPADARRDPVERTVVSDRSGLVYRPGPEVYVYGWKTDASWSGTCRDWTMRLKDGTTHVARFEFR